MMKSRFLLLLLMLSALVAVPATAMAVDEPATSSSVPATTDSTTDPTSTAPITLDQEAIDALNQQGDASDSNQSAVEKASDFVTNNAPWFIIGIILLAAITAGILIMKGRPRNSEGKTKAAKVPKASKSTKAMRDAGGLPGETRKDQPAQVPSAAELRRRKRAAIQRSREEERLRRKAEIENRKAARRGEAPVAPVAAAAAGAAAVTATGAAAVGLDPVEAEKQGARDQEIAAGAVARFEAPPETAPATTAPATTGQTIPAPVSPSQTAPAAGVVTPDTLAAPEAAPAAETSILHEPSIESPGADAAVGNAAQDFLAGGAAGAAAGAAGGLAAARASQPDETAAEEPVAEEPVVEEPESLEPVVSPEPGMAPEHALAEPRPTLPDEPAAQPDVPVAGDAAAIGAEERLRAKVAEIKATQAPPVAEPAPPAVVAEPTPLEHAEDLSPGLAAVERKLSENSEERDRALRDAEERLRRVEQRAEDAERRAAFAERLAQLKLEESEREKRLNDVVSGIDRAEQRAREAEARAEAAERAAAAALEQSEPGISATRPAPVSPAPPVPPSSPEPPVAPVFETRQEIPALEPDTPVPSAAGDPAAPAPARKGLFGGGSTESVPSSSDSVNLNGATFEELREAGLSVTQATRILAYRERFGGYDSVDDLEKVPGFPSDLITSLRGRISV